MCFYARAIAVTDCNLVAAATVYRQTEEGSIDAACLLNLLLIYIFASQIIDASSRHGVVGSIDGVLQERQIHEECERSKLTWRGYRECIKKDFVTGPHPYHPSLNLGTKNESIFHRISTRGDICSDLCYAPVT